MDEDFSLFEELYQNIQRTDAASSAPSSVASCDSEEEEEVMCSCSDTVEEQGVLMCRGCGREIQENKGNRWSGIEGGRGVSDPTRCQARKVDEKSIFKDVETYGFSPAIVHVANDIYIQVTDSKIYRGESRRGIIFSCIFHAFKLSGAPQSSDSLNSVFKLDRKVMLKGMKHVSLHAPKDSAFRRTYITPIEIIDETMTKPNATKEHKQEVNVLYDLVRNRSSMVNRSKPQSVAAGLVFYYITKQNKRVTMKDFTKLVGLSELTIQKLVKEIERILDGGPDVAGGEDVDDE